MMSVNQRPSHFADGLLIVDDVPEIRRLIRRVIPRSLPIREARSGEAARESLLSEPPRVVILDIGLGGDITGLDLLQLIRSEPSLRQTRVLVVTGRDDFAPEGSELLRQIDGFFRKPFSPLALADQIRALLAKDSPQGESS